MRKLEKGRTGIRPQGRRSAAPLQPCFFQEAFCHAIKNASLFCLLSGISRTESVLSLSPSSSLFPTKKAGCCSIRLLMIRFFCGRLDQSLPQQDQLYIRWVPEAVSKMRPPFAFALCYYSVFLFYAFILCFFYIFILFF